MSNRPLQGIGIVSVHFESWRLAPTLRSLASLRGGLTGARTVYVANSAPAAGDLGAALRGHDGEHTVLTHDNSGWEFGAYQAGLDWHGHWDPDWILFANDTFSSHQDFPFDYEELLLDELHRNVDHPVAVGQIESLRRSFVIAGHRTHRWITSNVFALNRPAIRALRQRVYDPSLEALIRETSDARAFFDDRLDPVLAGHLAAWLFETGDAPHWYRAQRLYEDNAAAMAGKARSILQEKRLTAVLEGASTELVDIKEIGLMRELRRKVRMRLRRTLVPSSHAGSPPRS